MIWNRLEEEQRRPELMLEAADWYLELVESTGGREYEDMAYALVWAARQGIFPTYIVNPFGHNTKWYWMDYRVTDNGSVSILPPFLFTDGPSPQTTGQISTLRGYISLMSAFHSLSIAIRTVRDMFPVSLEDLVRREDN